MVRIHAGAEAERLLNDPVFRAKWAALYAACPWGTCFQDIPFVTTWYRCYADRFQPLIITEDANDGPGRSNVESGRSEICPTLRGAGSRPANDFCHGPLGGLFTLALNKQTGSLVVAGAQQAEYQAWLAEPADGNRFIEAATRELARVYPRDELQLLFVPPGTPLDWTSMWGKQCVVRSIARPLMRTQPADHVRETLAEKRYRTRLKRWEKDGPLSLDRLVTMDEFRNALDEIADICDFRQGAMFGSLPFHSDPHKKAFYFAMMDQPGLLHATVLRSNGHIAAAHLGPCNKGDVVFGIVTHSPFFARQSAGKYLVLLLGLRLEEDGFTALDLTPGQDYKDRFATHHDEVHILTLFLSPSSARVYHAQRAAVEFGKRFVSPERAKSVLHVLRHKIGLTRPRDVAGKLSRFLKRSVYEDREFRIYRRAAADVQPPSSTIMRRDCLHDLILYDPAEAWQPPVDAFLRSAMKRLEDGEHVYTYADNERLIHWGWLKERQETAFASEVGQSFEMPPDSAVLYDYYTHPSYRGKGLYQKSLAQMAYDAASIPGTKNIYIAALKSNAVSCHVIEKAGFQHERSLFRKKMFGRTIQSRKQ